MELANSTEKKGTEDKWLEENIGKMIGGFLIVVVSLIIELILLRSLSVFNSGYIGTYILLKGLAAQFIFLLIVAGFALAILSSEEVGFLRWLYYPVVVLVNLIVVGLSLASSLDKDVEYSWIAQKAGLNFLSLQYLNGWTIIVTAILAIILVLSYPKIAYKKGKDGKYHTYAASKVASLIRYAVEEQGNEKPGDNADCSVLADKKSEEVSETVNRGFGYELRREEYGERRYDNRTYTNVRWNDLVRINSWYFLVWTLAKVVFGTMLLAFVLDSDAFILRFLAIRNYVDSSGISWTGLIGNYLSILWMRITGTVNVPADFGIVNTPTYEAFGVVMWVVNVVLAVWFFRLIISAIEDLMAAGRVNNANGAAIKNVIAKILAIFSMLLFGSVIAIPSGLFDAASPYYAWETIMFFIAFVLAALVVRFAIKDSAFESPLDSVVAWLKTNTYLKLGMVMFLIVLLIAPIFMEAIFVGPYMQGRQEEYRWKPATYPSIQYTQWANGVDNITRINYKAITVSNKEVLGSARIFDKEAAKLNMKPDIGNDNWLSIGPSDADIVMRNGKEYWFSIMTLVRPQYPSDTDIWRVNHLLLTHSEKAIAVDAATSEPINLSKVFGMNETPLIYYGEGGLWSDTDEVYIDVNGKNVAFNETHLLNYNGPASYDGQPDYTYKGLWRLVRFVPMGRFDFAQGDYGDIRALVTRDVQQRASKLLLPGMSLEPDAYPVWDDSGNISSLYWITVSWKAPHRFGGYPEENEDKIIRKIGVLLVDNKEGFAEGYFFNKGKDDYITSFYKSMYPSWNRPMPSWLVSQLRYPEQFMEEQIRVYNEAFQTDFQAYQRNDFYESAKDENNQPIEEIRYIMMPLRGQTTWSAVKLVEPYNANTRNLAGMYIAPGANRTGEMYFVDFKGMNLIGPDTAVKTVGSNTELSRDVAFKTWVHGNVLLYSVDRPYYVIPYYLNSGTTLLPQMVAVVNADAQSRAVGAYIIKTPTDYNEVSMAAINAFEQIGVKITPEESAAIGRIIISGTVTGKYEYTRIGNTRWFIDIQGNNSLVKELIGKAEALSDSQISKLLHLKIGDSTKIEADTNDTILRFVE